MAQLPTEAEINAEAARRGLTDAAGRALPYLRAGIAKELYDARLEAEAQEELLYGATDADYSELDLESIADVVFSLDELLKRRGTLSRVRAAVCSAVASELSAAMLGTEEDPGYEIAETLSEMEEHMSEITPALTSLKDTLTRAYAELSARKAEPAVSEEDKKVLAEIAGLAKALDDLTPDDVTPVAPEQPATPAEPVTPDTPVETPATPEQPADNATPAEPVAPADNAGEQPATPAEPVTPVNPVDAGF